MPIDRNIHKKNSFIIVLMAVMGMFIACTDKFLADWKSSSTEILSFEASLGNDTTRIQSSTRGTFGKVSFVEEDWALTENSRPVTKAAPLLQLGGDAGIFVQGTSAILENGKYSFNGDELTATTPTYWADAITGSDGNAIQVYAYAPFVTGQNSTSFTYTADNSDVSKQKDIIAAYSEVVKKDFRTPIKLTFNHILTAIRLKVGFGCIVKSVSIEGVKPTGTYTIGGAWNVSGENTEYKIIFNEGNGKDFNEGTLLNDGAQTLMLIPQTLGDDSKVTLETTERTYTYTLKNVVWEKGKMITYTLHDEETPDYIYFDLAAGKVTIEPGENKVTGYVYEKGESVPTEKTYTHQSGNKYYVYQSTAKKREGGTGVLDGETIILPVYERVTYGGKSWSEYITNNTDVEGIIKAWDNEAGAGKSLEKKAVDDISINNSGAAGAVRNVGREVTKNRIHIAGNLGSVNLFIDNIYSSYQQRGATPVRKRDQGGISFLPSQKDNGNSTLTINIIGDNRLGCVNYQNNIKTRNCLIFEGSGSLTVADVDYYRDATGLGSNRSCSVIGGKDEPQSEEDVYNIVFNSGVIYAGATTSACTAIGGGGNGNTSIIIKGGTITAVAKSTGTAIGGGTGLVQPGGEGDVSIEGGNVYAYNYRNSSNVPSSAIGGAGSRDVAGSLGVVNISGGYVYAYSQYGTAIGGGSSQNTTGGAATVKITGGMVIAKSGDGASIGGGSACTGGNASANYNGGTATITISGNPIIRTGSVGGGSTGAGKGKIGSADITIEGGDIQAQFVLAKGTAQGSINSFTMNGGIIRNSNTDNTAETEYLNIKEEGGAVWLQDGKCEISGGTIENCMATEGGAIYIAGTNNPTFTMTGGVISNCTSQGNGGAVYLEGGTVTLEGGTISDNLASGGHGGGIYIEEGSFYMPKNGTATITENSAIFRDSKGGDGGGLYVTSEEKDVTVELLSGTITQNTSDHWGGGVCVDMSGTEQAAKVTVGTSGETDPDISGNHTLLSGGGLYVSGEYANIIINGGNIDGNSTSAYVPNVNVANEGGMVTLIGGNVSHKVVTFYANDGTDTSKTQKIVTATNSLLVAPEFKRTGYRLAGWNTRADGRGTSYSDGATMNINTDLTLYAQWELQ